MGLENYFLWKIQFPSSRGYPYGAENRNGWTLKTIADRAKNPNFETKSDFNV